jgi:hypothetical protein
MNDSISDGSPWLARYSKKGGRAAGGARLRLIAGRRPIRGALAPIAGATGKQFEGGVSGYMFKNPAEIVGVIGRNAQLGIVGHDLSQTVEGWVGHDPALVLPAFWPGIRKQDEHAIDRGRRERRDHQSRIIGKDPNIVEPTPLDLGKQLDYPVLEYFAADEANLRMLFGHLSEMLAPAETDLEPNRGACVTEKGGDVEVTRCRKI